VAPGGRAGGAVAATTVALRRPLVVQAGAHPARAALTVDATHGVEITSVADDEVVIHRGGAARAYTDLAPGTTHDLDGVTVRTLDHPGGELLCRFATVNDVHFGEVRAGVMEGTDYEPLEVEPGEEPYAEMMNAAAVAEIAAIDPAAVVAKGDLTTRGTAEEYERFLAVYGGAFGERLHHVRGNHDAMAGRIQGVDGIPALVEVPGARLALLDTVVPGRDGGQVSAEQLAWLDDVAADADRDGIALLAFGHHHCWDPGSRTRPANYFGINPDDSERLIGVFARHRSLRGWFAGHTHRNRVRRFPATGGVPFVEVACVKDFPGTWAEYRVYEGGILQVHRRLSSDAALSWSERCRSLFGGLYPDYAFGSLEDRCFPLP
jgi:predicted phosphodiesterase